MSLIQCKYRNAFIATSIKRYFKIDAKNPFLGTSIKRYFKTKIKTLF